MVASLLNSALAIFTLAQGLHYSNGSSPRSPHLRHWVTQYRSSRFIWRPGSTWAYRGPRSLKPLSRWRSMRASLQPLMVSLPRRKSLPSMTATVPNGLPPRSQVIAHILARTPCVIGASANAVVLPARASRIPKAGPLRVRNSLIGDARASNPAQADEPMTA